METLSGFWWLLLLVGPLLFFQRSLHREIQAVFLLITRRIDISMILFSILFFPGILLHETSHYLMAKLLGVRTGHFSLIPRVITGPIGQPTGRIQLGYVETSRSDIIRDSLIGAAPLFTGGLFVAYAGLMRLGMQHLWGYLASGDLGGFLETLRVVLSQSDSWLWLYLVFVVSSLMLPSASDRRAWLPLGVFLGVILVLSLLAGAGPWLMENFAPPLNRVLLSLDIVLGISLGIHFVFLIPMFLLRIVLSRLLGMRVV